MNDQPTSELVAEGEKKDPRVFKIPSPNMARFTDKLEKLQRRAKRIGCVSPSYTLLKEEPKTIQVEVGREEDVNGREKIIYEDRVIMINHLILHYPSVRLEGYDFLAALEHTEEGNILHTLPGKTVPHKYRECDPWCDHCKTKRYRKDTFVLEHLPTHTYLQVGRNCLGDFLGRNAEMYANMCEVYYELSEYAEACENEGSGSWGGSGERLDMLDNYLSFVAEMIARDGWKSKSYVEKAGQGSPTSSEAYRHMHPSMFDVSHNLLLFRHPSEKSIQVAKDAIAWCENLTDEEVNSATGDYLHNIRLIARRGVAGYRQIGYAASIVAAYQRHLGQLKAKEQQTTKPSEHVGVVGERRDFEVSLLKIVSWDTQYGTTHLHIFTDKEGNRLTWKSSGTKLEEGYEYIIKGTVKKHSDYKGTKQTELTRCKEVSKKG